MDGGIDRIVLINESNIEDWIDLYSNQKAIGDLVEEIKHYPNLSIKQRKAVATLLRNHRKSNNKFTYKNLVDAKRKIEGKYGVKSTLQAENFLSIIVN